MNGTPIRIVIYVNQVRVQVNEYPDIDAAEAGAQGHLKSAHDRSGLGMLIVSADGVLIDAYNRNRTPYLEDYSIGDVIQEYASQIELGSTWTHIDTGVKVKVLEIITDEASGARLVKYNDKGRVRYRSLYGKDGFTGSYA